MKRHSTLLLALVAVLALGGVASARGFGGGRGGGGGGRTFSMSRPATSVSRPGSSLPATRPSSLPATRPPHSWSGSVATLPSSPGARPAAPPSLHRPGTLPASPGTLPSIGRPGSIPDMNAGFLRPSGGAAPVRPGAAGTLPATPGLGSIGSMGSVTRPAWNGRPPVPTRPDLVLNRPAVSASAAIAQHLGRLPGGVGRWEGERLAHWGDWHRRHQGAIDDFWRNHSQRWGEIRDFRRDRWGAIRERGEPWRNWQRSVWGYRLGRSYCVADALRDYYCHLFTPDWWRGCGWWHRPGVVWPVSPWWWWRPYAWSSWTFIYAEPAPAPVIYDYGTDIVVESGQVYVEGQPVASTEEYRRQAIRIGTPAEAPAPPAPAEAEGAESEWMPLGVWALTQEEQGDAVMFYQLSVTRKGVISGAYTNVLTGVSDPVTGSVDRESQRVVWHTGDATGTMLETNLHSLTQDRTPVLVHFANGSSQTWLLVRLSAPEGSAGTAPSR